MRRCAVFSLLMMLMMGFAITSECRSEPGRARRPKATRTVYVLDNEQFAKELGAATTDEQRSQLLETRWGSIMLAVSHCHTVSMNSFHTSVAYWRSGGRFPNKVDLYEGDLTEPIRKAEKAAANPADPAHPADDPDKKPDGESEPPPENAPQPRGFALFLQPNLTIVTGNCVADVTLPSAGKIHIYGDLRGTLSVKGQSEIIIGGSVAEKAVIETDGIVKIFVGGDVAGTIQSKGSMDLWVHGDLTGTVLTGSPRTDIHVIGDLWGTIKPIREKGSMTSLEVRGFASHLTIESLAALPHTKFDGSIAESNVEPGFYPAPGVPANPRLVLQHMTFNCVVHRQIDLLK